MSAPSRILPPVTQLTDSESEPENPMPKGKAKPTTSSKAAAPKATKSPKVGTPKAKASTKSPKTEKTTKAKSKQGSAVEGGEGENATEPAPFPTPKKSPAKKANGLAFRMFLLDLDAHVL